MAKVKVTMKKNALKQGLSLTDPETGVMICKQRMDKQMCQLVERTKFVDARIKSGDLIEVSMSAKELKALEKNDADAGGEQNGGETETNTGTVGEPDAETTGEPAVDGKGKTEKGKK